jgi:hypothetical protein
MYSWVFERLKPRSKRFNIRRAKCIELARFSHHFVRMTLNCKIRAECGGVFQSHHDGSEKYFELGRIRGFDFRLAIEVVFDWYSFDKPCLVSTICIQEYSNVWISFKTVQYCMCEIHRIIAVSHHLYVWVWFAILGPKMGIFISSRRLPTTHWIRSNKRLWLSLSHGSEVRLIFVR